MALGAAVAPPASCFIYTRAPSIVWIESWSSDQQDDVFLRADDKALKLMVESTQQKHITSAW